MAKKQNGFGGKSFAFKTGNNRTDVGKIKKSQGVYPGDRRYGSTVVRTIIEQKDKNSNWVKWRKGYEYYNQAAWYRLEEKDPITGEYVDAVINSVLFQGTSEEIAVKFDGYKFATKNSDTNNHYVMKRSLDEETDYSIGTVTQVKTDEKNKKVQIKIDSGPNVEAILNMIGDRITDGETSATVDSVFTADNLPALYTGKTLARKPAKTIVYIPYSDLEASPWFQARNNDLQELVNEIVYVPTFYQRKPVSYLQKSDVIDYPNYFEVDTTLISTDQEIIIFDYDKEDLLPPTLYDVADIPDEKLVVKTTGTTVLDGEFIFNKAQYQPYYGLTYFTGQLAVENIKTFSYVILPFKVQAVLKQEDQVLVESVPIMSEIKAFADLTDGIIQLEPNSFTKLNADPKKEGWKILDTDVNPYIDEVFTTGGALKPDTVYACSCPSFSKTMLRAPQETQDEGTRKINRQQRYPMPTMMTPGTYEKIGLNQTAGRAQSWATTKDLREFRMCKHSIAAMFIEHIKVLEPNDYPSLESRETFEAKLRKDIEEVAEEFVQSYKRGGISALEVIFAMSQALGMDDVETAYVVLNANF